MNSELRVLPYAPGPLVSGSQGHPLRSLILRVRAELDLVEAAFAEQPLGRKPERERRIAIPPGIAAQAGIIEP